MPVLLISLPPTTSVWGVKFKICFMNITTCTAWIWIFPYMFFCVCFPPSFTIRGSGIPCSAHIRHESGFILLHIRTVDAERAKATIKKRGNAFATPLKNHPSHHRPCVGALVCAACRVGLLYAVWLGRAAWVNELFGRPVQAYTEILSAYVARTSDSKAAARFFRRRCFFRESCCIVKRFLRFLIPPCRFFQRLRPLSAPRELCRCSRMQAVHPCGLRL